MSPILTEGVEDQAAESRGVMGLLTMVSCWTNLSYSFFKTSLFAKTNIIEHNEIIDDPILFTPQGELVLWFHHFKGPIS